MRDWRGLSFLTSYTYSKSTNNTPGLFPGNPSRGGTVTDPSCVTPGRSCNLGLDEGPADYDIPHRFTFAGTYRLHNSPNVLLDTLGNQLTYQPSDARVASDVRNVGANGCSAHIEFVPVPALT